VTTAKAGGLALILFALAGMAWFALELAPPMLGFPDTDDPALSLQFLRAHPTIYPLAGIALFAMAVGLAVGTFAVSDALAPRGNSLTVRSLCVLGLVAAAFFFAHGVLRFGVGPLLHIDDLSAEWGQAAYLAVQMGGIHGSAQGATLALCGWAVGISVLGLRIGTIPRWLGLLGIVPGFRLLAVLGPFGFLPDALWIAFIAAVPGAMLWCLALGIVLTWLKQPDS
jgi:hypothetical protein